MRFSCQEVTLGQAVRTLHAGSDALFNTRDTVLELLLRNAQVLVGVGQVLDFLVELLLDLRELLDAERVQVDWEGNKVSARDVGHYTTARCYRKQRRVLGLLWFPLPASAMVCELSIVRCHKRVKSADRPLRSLGLEGQLGARGYSAHHRCARTGEQ